MTLDMLIFGAHPDDAEIGMGATIVKHTNAGYKVGICDLTYAEMSSNGNVETRKQEAEEASRIMGLAARTNLGLPDRGLFVCAEQIEAITLEIRKWRPRIVFAPYWEDRHPDHVLCSQLVQQAVFNAKLRRYAPQAEPVTVEKTLFYFINDLHEADLLVDVSAEYEQKMASLRAYRTQFEPAGQSNDFVSTPLNQGYLERVEARDRVLGQKQLVPYAEGFVTRLPYVVDLF
ncbi:bacillithiol biosynthesis deacetylase BshB1 [Paenibacillus contaminans]|uniref:Bacillithiol biosynthesis deacetylase BshB1 n=1 Tax=Paenibacillus contaminans TaxID=450362 RepID=A0A329MEU5_9BACL|nr:bacillithiol biosynthesis deacetylase BshB1 [Paenibacillus contaminans]RAV18494.1 bacillithiol biosynthesis deacetylase BshB1 [Paenibacillus contaminans]